MYQSPNLLNDDGSASMATMLMMAHHAFRRDAVRFIMALEQMKAGDMSRADAVHEEWKQSYRLALHGHHQMEDSVIFPDIKKKHPEAATALATLSEQHHHIDPLLDRGDQAFADLSHPKEALAVLKELKGLLDTHLAFEEAEIAPFLRDEKHFPTPSTDAEAEMYANGFAWSMQGIHPEVLDAVRKLLPENLLSRFPAAQKTYDERCDRVWGSADVGLSKTSVPIFFQQ